MWPDPRLRDDITLPHAGALGLGFRRAHPLTPIDGSLARWLGRVVVPRVVWAFALALVILPVLVFIWWSQVELHWVTFPGMSR